MLSPNRRRGTPGHRLGTHPRSISQERRRPVGARRWRYVVCSALLCLVGACGLTGANTQVITCATGQTVWDCIIKPTSCNMAQSLQACGANVDEAIAGANLIAFRTFKPRDPIVGTTCVDTGRTKYINPTFSTQNSPTCDVFTTDDACQVCAKTSCCTAYVACFEDLNCSCLVGCLYNGGTVAACTSAEQCGPASTVSNVTAACLSTSCPGQCASMGGMTTCQGGTGGSTGTGGSSGVGGSPSSCGSFGAGETCFSNGDCASCMCNQQSMTCN
jgi:hypothetical protein